MDIKFKRILLKLSGEALVGEGSLGISPEIVGRIAEEISMATTLGVEVCVVVGGGNIFRGLQKSTELGMDRAQADYVGMLATIMNALVLQGVLEKRGIETRVQTALNMNAIAEPYIRRRAQRHLNKGRVVIFGGGTGNPFFTTDTAAALRASEMDCNLMMMAKNGVDGVYSADPNKDPKATRFSEISYDDVIQKDLKIMDTAAISLCKDKSVPIAVTYHGSEPERIALFGRIASRCDLVITPSYKSADDLREIGGVPENKLRVIGLGVKPMPDYPDAEVAELRANLMGDGTHVIVTLARLMHQKGIDILIECVARMKDSNPGFRFVVAGDGPDAEMLQNLARDRGVSDHLTFVGRTEKPHLYLRAADLFLLTSRWEALPFSIVEAFQAGIPAVATACSGVVELIDDEVGAVVPIGDVDAICEAVSSVLLDRESRRQMSEAAKIRGTEDRCQPEWVHEQFEKTYLSLAGKR